MKQKEGKDLTKSIDYEAVEAIASNCSLKDYEDCKRLLKKQSNELIEKIYYELMYDELGNETDFVPIGCTYSVLSDLLFSLGGKYETFGEKTKRNIRKKIKEYEKKVSEVKNKLENLESEYLEKLRILKGEDSDELPSI